MKKRGGLLLIAVLYNILLHAQVGAASIATISLGQDSLYTAAIGAAQLPACSLPGPCNSACAVYTFIGAGNWDVPGNWFGNMMPPVVLSGCTQIVIDPAGGNECLFNIPYQLLPPGTNITVAAGKNFRIPGNIQ